MILTGMQWYESHATAIGKLDPYDNALLEYIIANYADIPTQDVLCI